MHRGADLRCSKRIYLQWHITLRNLLSPVCAVRSVGVAGFGPVVINAEAICAGKAPQLYCLQAQRESADRLHEDHAPSSPFRYLTVSSTSATVVGSSIGFRTPGWPPAST